MKRAELEQFQGATVDDLIGPNVRLMFVGINPGLWTAAVNAHFARPGNRFWPALFRAGITEQLIDVSSGMAEHDRQHLIDRGIAITNIVPIATARADELTAQQLRDGGAELLERVRRHRPAVVAVLGITAYRAAFGQAKARPGRQAEPLAASELWVAPNPSGLNAHATVESLAADYRAAAEAAGVVAPVT